MNAHATLADTIRSAEERLRPFATRVISLTLLEVLPCFLALSRPAVATAIVLQ